MRFFALFSVRNTVQSDTSDAYRSHANLLRGCHCCFQTVTTITGHSPKPRRPQLPVDYPWTLMVQPQANILKSHKLNYYYFNLITFKTQDL